LNKEVSQFIQVGGLLAMVLFVILLEGAPVFIGGGLATAAILAMGTINPLIVFFLFIVSALIGNVIYFYLGYFSGKKILRYFDKNHVKKYRRLFKKYGFAAMIFMAISPVPYLPTLAGVFRMKSLGLITGVLIIRMLRHTAVFLFWIYVLGFFG